MVRTDTPPAGDERSVMMQMLEYVQQTALFKVRGLTEELARTAPISTSPLTNPASLLNHLRWNEHYWVEVVILGREDRAPWSEEHPDGELEAGLERAAAGGHRRLLRAGAAHPYAARRSRLRRRVRQGRSRTSTPTCAGSSLHLIEETARHNGHLDLLREMADGSVGD